MTFFCAPGKARDSQLRVFLPGGYLNRAPSGFLVCNAQRVSVESDATSWLLPSAALPRAGSGRATPPPPVLGAQRMRARTPRLAGAPRGGEPQRWGFNARASILSDPLGAPTGPPPSPEPFYLAVRGALDREHLDPAASFQTFCNTLDADVSALPPDRASSLLGCKSL